MLSGVDNVLCEKNLRNEQLILGVGITWDA